MEIRVLGTMEVLDPDVVPLGGPTQRRTLGMLLVNVGQTVSIDQLVDGIWTNGDTPERAEQNVPKYVHRLRGTMGRYGDRIETVGTGYRLHVESDELDATRFEALIAEARAAMSDGEPGRVVELLDEALGLWRGRPYDDVADLDWARAEVARLTELRASAIERRFDVLLGEGRHTEVIGPLQEATGDEPWREPRRGQLAWRSTAPAGRPRRCVSSASSALNLPRSSGSVRHRISMSWSIGSSTTMWACCRRRIGSIGLRGYELEAVIGEGAFSLVWRGTQPTLGRTVAAKQIRAELANQPDFIRRFETEAQTVAAL